MRGRKKTPEHIKAIKGTSRPDRENAHAPPTIPLRAKLEVPQFLRERGAAKWIELMPLLNAVMGDQDLHNLEALCVAYQNFRDAQDYVDEHGIVIEFKTGVLHKNPALAVVSDSLRQIQMYGSNLGLDPASRSRMVMGIGGKGKEDDDNPFAKIGKRA